MDTCLGPYVPLDEERLRVTAFWAPLVVQANLLATQTGLANQRKAVLDRATWAVTEIERGADTKLFRQRYWSFAALRWAAQTFTDAMSRTERGRLAASALRHEHVVSRRMAIRRLIGCTDVNSATEVLAGCVACVVTASEADSLIGEDDWNRYRRARVQVFDRQLRCEHAQDE